MKQDQQARRAKERRPEEFIEEIKKKYAISYFEEMIQKYPPSLWHSVQHNPSIHLSPDLYEQREHLGSESK